MTDRERFERLAALARHMERGQFVRDQAGFFFIGKIPEDEAGAYLGYSTGSYNIRAMKAAYEASLKREDLAVPPGYFVQPVRKKPGNDWVKWISVGRARNNDVVLRASSVSKLHAQINTEPPPGEPEGSGGYWITDLESAKGTFVNGRRVAGSERHALNPGDRVRFGRVECRFVDAGQLHDALRSLR